MYVTEAKLRSNLYLTDLPPGSPLGRQANPPGARSQASALWAVRRRRKRGGSVVSKGVQGTAVPWTTIANLTERA